MRRNELQGTGMVFRFTLGQYLKSRSVIMSMVVMLLVTIISMLAVAAGMSGRLKDTSAISDIVVYDIAGTGITADDIRAAGGLEAGIQIRVFSAGSQLTENFGNGTAVVSISADPSGKYSVTAKADTEESSLTDFDLNRAADAVCSALESAMSPDAGRGVSQVYAWSGTVSEYLSPEDEGSSDARMVLTYVYDIIVMVLVLFSSSYIVRSVIEEKASRLVEMLMVSVKPLALLVGKILAAMVLVLIELVMLLAGMAAASIVTMRLFGTSSAAILISTAGLDLTGLKLGIPAIAVFVISVVLAYCLFALMAGIAGVRCSKMEDVETANVSVVLTVMFGYLASVICAVFTGTAAAHITSLLPLISVFTAPVRWLLGEISTPVVLLSWLIQAAVIILLAMLVRKVYGELIMYRGAKLKLTQVLRSGEKAGVRS